MSNPIQTAAGWVRSSLTLKVFFTGFLVLLLLIPSAMVGGVINERANTLSDAQKEVGEKWGKEQTVGGPVISVPYNRFGRRYYAYFLPDSLTIEAEAKSQIRQRGSFEVILYTGDLTLKGAFAAPDVKALGITDPKSLLWNEAALQIGITDLRGLQDIPEVQWGTSTLAFQPNTRKEVFDSSLTTPLAGFSDKSASSFSIHFKLNGSESLYFLPVGRQTTVQLKSDWPTPSFAGAFLPSQRTVDENGFESEWKVLDLNRSFPQSWTDEGNVSRPFFSLAAPQLYYSPSKDSFGLEFLLPVDVYQKSERSVKYAGLFIVLTFLVFFLFEIFLKTRIHPIQYLMVGFALALFYLLLLSLSEQMPFGWAYLAGSAATVALVSGYTSAFLRKKSMAGLLGGILSGLYIYLYVLLAREDYSLLMGSVGLFVILALVMFLTRKIDWYQAGAQG